MKHNSVKCQGGKFVYDINEFVKILSPKIKACIVVVEATIVETTVVGATIAEATVVGATVAEGPITAVAAAATVRSVAPLQQLWGCGKYMPPPCW